MYNVLNSWSPAEESIESFFEQVSVMYSLPLFALCVNLLGLVHNFSD